jgi:oleandomycin transport system ATP-binding protein
MGVLVQDGALFGSMNLFDNIAFPLREHTKKSEKEIREIVMTKGELVGLLDHMKKFPGEVSGGMKKRAGLARALALDPKILFYDEPSAGLDPGKREELWRMVRGLSADGVTVLLTTQYLEEADALADTVAVIDRGHVVASGTPAELKQRVGGHTIVLRPDEPAGLDGAAAVLAAVTGRTPQRTTRDGLAVPVTGDDDFFEIAARLRAQRIGVSELALRLPSLDEVYHALTAGTAGAAR